MRIEPSRSAVRDRATAHQDRAFQRAILEHVVDLHPVQATVSELVRQLARDPDDFRERDGIERAVRDLAAVGLLHRPGLPDGLVTPTRAALVAHDLLLDEGGDDARIA